MTLSCGFDSFHVTLSSPFRFHANSSLCFVFIMLCWKDHICSQLLLFTIFNMIYKHVFYLSHRFLDNSVLELFSSARLNHLRIDIILVCGCKRTGGIRFTINGRDYFELVLISNVGGAGDVSRVWIKGSKMSNWEPMSRNWGANWQSLSYLNGQSLSFRVQLSNGRIRTAYNVAPSTWRFGQSFISKVQF